jgi:hypothetical protein
VVTHLTRIDLRAYNVGFGDCLLLSFSYDTPIDGRQQRHILIDYGSNKAAVGGEALGAIAQRIKADCGGKLDVIVLSHRHRDHLVGFDPAIGGETIRSLQPDLVLRPWTEVPESQVGHVQKAQRELLDIVRSGHEFAAKVADIPFSNRPSPLERNLLDLSGLQLRNVDAMAVLDDLANRGSGRYLRYGDQVDLTMIPEVKVHVLGPPDPVVWPQVRQQAASSTEYWLGLGGMAPASVASSLAGAPIAVLNAGRKQAAELLAPGAVRWAIDQLGRHQLSSTIRLTHALDSVLNNTSLILVFEAMGHTMLFPGDAQIENWGYALNGAKEREANRALLAKVDLYKVGHHGSRNATPAVSLMPLWADLPTAPLAVMSTLSGYYNDGNPVPNIRLRDRLATSPFSLLSTEAQALPQPATTSPLVHVAVDSTKGARFAKV